MNADFPLIHRNASRRMSPTVRADGDTVWSSDIGDREFDVLGLDVRREESGGIVYDVLGAEDEVLVRDRVYAVDGRPVCWARSYFDSALVEGTAIERRVTGPGGTPARLAEIGHELVSFVETVSFREPAGVDADERDKLQIDEHVAVVRILREGGDAAGRNIEFTDMRLVASAYVFRWVWSNR